MNADALEPVEQIEFRTLADHQIHMVAALVESLDRGECVLIGTPADHAGVDVQHADRWLAGLASFESQRMRGAGGVGHGEVFASPSARQ